MKAKYLALIVVVVLALTALSCGPAETPAPPTATPTPEVHPGQALVSSRCGSCHGLNVVEAAGYNADGWKITVDRMVMSGAQLNEEQTVQVIDYLAVTYPKE